MEAMGLLLFLVLGIVSLACFIWGIVFIARDAKEHDQSPALWIVLFIFLGVLGLAIYMFVTKRIGWGLFWLIGFPIIITVLFFVAFAGMLSGF